MATAFVVSAFGPCSRCEWNVSVCLLSACCVCCGGGRVWVWASSTLVSSVPRRHLSRLKATTPRTGSGSRTTTLRTFHRHREAGHSTGKWGKSHRSLVEHSPLRLEPSTPACFVKQHRRTQHWTKHECIPQPMLLHMVCLISPWANECFCVTLAIVPTLLHLVFTLADPEISSSSHHHRVIELRSGTSRQKKRRKGAEKQA